MQTASNPERYPSTAQVRFRAELVNAVLHAATQLGRAQQQSMGLRIGHIGDDYAAFTLVREDAQAPETRNYLVRVPHMTLGAGLLGRFDDSGRQVTPDAQDRAFAVMFSQALQVCMSSILQSDEEAGGAPHDARLH